MERHLRTVHKIEGPVNVKPDGFDEKMAKKAKKLFWRQRKALMPPELDDGNSDENSEEKFAQNGLLDLSSSTAGQKIKKSPGKKLMKSNKSKKNSFLAVLNFF